MRFCCSPCRVSSTEAENLRNDPDSPYDADIPARNRNYTDLIYFKVLVVYFVFLLISVSVAGIRGDIRRAVNGYDEKGNVCGYKNEPIKDVIGSGLDLTGYDYLDVRVNQSCKGEECRAERTCVKKCKYGYEDSIIPSCAVRAGKGNSKAVSFFEKLYLDTILCWKEITVLCFFSVCLCGLVLTALRIFPVVVIWTVFAIVSVASVGGTIFLWYENSTSNLTYLSTEKRNSTETWFSYWLFLTQIWTMFILKHQAMQSYEGPNMERKRQEIFSLLLMATFISIFTVIFFIMLCSVRKKVKLIAALFEEGGKCIIDMPMMLSQPIWTHAWIVVLAIFVAVGIASLQTSGKATVTDEGKVTFPVNALFQVIHWPLFFAFIWLCLFRFAIQDIIIAGCVASWYFTRVKGKIVNPVCNSMKNIAKYHIGSAAFGSLILAAVQAIRILVHIFKKGAKKDGNFVLVLLYAFVECLLACMQSILEILTKTAYVMIVLYGEDFCVSARKAFDLITENTTRIVAIDGVGSFILHMIEIFISLFITFIGAALFMNFEGLQNFWIPVIVVLILSFMCCHCFVSVYDMSINTLILCFCVDCHINDGLANPYFMSTTLRIFLSEGRNSVEMASTQAGSTSQVIT